MGGAGGAQVQLCVCVCVCGCMLDDKGKTDLAEYLWLSNLTATLPYSLPFPKEQHLKKIQCVKPLTVPPP